MIENTEQMPEEERPRKHSDSPRDLAERVRVRSRQKHLFEDLDYAYIGQTGATRHNGDNGDREDIRALNDVCYEG